MLQQENNTKKGSAFNSGKEWEEVDMSFWKHIQLYFFFVTKLPLIFWCRPSIETLTPEQCHLSIPLTYWTKNHIGSMYFAVLMVGVDLASGLLAFHLIKSHKQPISIIFKDVHAQFLKRAEGRIRFECNQGKEIDAILQETVASKQRVNRTLDVKAIAVDTGDCVVSYSITLSVKVKDV